MPVRQPGGGLYKLNSVVTHSLKAPGFNPRAYKVKTRFKSLLFQMQTCTATAWGWCSRASTWASLSRSSAGSCRCPSCASPTPRHTAHPLRGTPRRPSLPRQGPKQWLRRAVDARQRGLPPVALRSSAIPGNLDGLGLSGATRWAVVKRLLYLFFLSILA